MGVNSMILGGQNGWDGGVVHTVNHWSYSFQERDDN